MTLLQCLLVILAIPICGTLAVVLIVRTFGPKMPSLMNDHAAGRSAGDEAEG